MHIDLRNSKFNFPISLHEDVGRKFSLFTHFFSNINVSSMGNDIVWDFSEECAGFYVHYYCIRVLDKHVRIVFQQRL